MKKYLLSRLTFGMLMGAIGVIAVPLSSVQAASDNLLGEVPTVYPGSSQDIAARQHGWQSAPRGAQGPMRSDMTEPSGYSTSPGADQTGEDWTQNRSRAGMFGELPTEYPK